MVERRRFTRADPEGILGAPQSSREAIEVASGDSERDDSTPVPASPRSTTQCLECMRSFHGLCGDCYCCNSSVASDVVSDSDVTEGLDNESQVRPAYDVFDPEAEWRVSEGGTKRGKADRALKDQQSTGRKRAAKLYPLAREENCEWRGKIRQGGGNKPIQGCTDGLQQSRHHGPDKNTLNNAEGNVHRICHGCHNRWHSGNDSSYIPGQPVLD